MHRRLSAGAAAVVMLTLAPARAQDIGGEGSAGQGAPVTVTGADGTTVNVTGTYSPPTSETTTTVGPMFGLPQPGWDPDGHLPSSSRSRLDINESRDTFDLRPGAGEPSVVRNPDGAAVLESRRAAGSVPSFHQVQRGDTLWDLGARYYNNPWKWPEIWSQNPQIQNPHWIYPGDQIRMRSDGEPARRASYSLGSTGRGEAPPGGLGLRSRDPSVPPDTIFLRTVGYIDDPKKDAWGELVGSHEEQMLLTEGNHVYMMMRPGVKLKLGQRLTVFRPIRPPTKIKGARQPSGEVIALTGTVKVDHWDPDKRVARGELEESLDIIERGSMVGPIKRLYEVVPPKRNEADVSARVLTSLHPHEFVGQNQVLFIDKGRRDGLRPGNRLLVVRRGDSWRRTLETSTRMARARVRTDVPEFMTMETTPLRGNEKDFPEEVIGEIRVVRADETTSLTIVTASTREIEPGDRVVARKGY